MNYTHLNLTNIEVGEIQLNRAIQLYLDEKDYVSSLTLAGAAEEILGALLNKAVEKNALDENIEASIQIGRKIFSTESNPKEIRDLANYFRNRLKHHNDQEPLGFSADYYAADMIDRAIQNYFKLTAWETSAMVRFKEVNLALLPRKDV